MNWLHSIHCCLRSIQNRPGKKHCGIQGSRTAPTFKCGAGAWKERIVHIELGRRSIGDSWLSTTGWSECKDRVSDTSGYPGQSFQQFLTTLTAVQDTYDLLSYGDRIFWGNLFFFLPQAGGRTKKGNLKTSLWALGNSKEQFPQFGFTSYSRERVQHRQ